MSTSNPLNLPLITDAQASKHVTHNDAILKLSQALGNRIEVDVSAGNATVTTDNAQRNYFVRIFGASAARTVTLPAVNRTLLVRSVAANAANVTLAIAGGSGTILMPPGSNALVVTTATNTIEAFFLAQSAVVSALVDLADFPSNYSGAGGKLLAVKADASGVEFIDPPSVGGGGADSLTELSDVIVFEPEEGHILVYDAGINAFVNVAANFAGGATQLSHLDDIALTNPAEGDALVYDSIQEKFVNRFLPGSVVGVSPSIKTEDYTLEVDDVQALVLLDGCDLIVPAYEDVPLPIGTTVGVVQWGETESKIIEAQGVVVNSADTLTFAKRYAGGSLVHVAENIWLFTAYTTEAS